MMDETKISTAKYIIDTVDLKFEKVYDKFQAIDDALTLREINVRKELDHLNNLRIDYEKSKLQDSKDYVKRDTYELEYKTLTKKVDWSLKIIYIGIGGLSALMIILKYFVH
jgi:hypothetical protein